MAVFKKKNPTPRIYLNIYIDKKRKRYTQEIVSYSDNIDTRATEISLMPNFIHAIDGSIIRMVVFYNKNNYGYLTVHDEF